MINKNQNTFYNMSKEEVLFQLLKKEHGYYHAIFEITRQEYEKLLANDPITEITSLLKKKKALLNCIQDIDSALVPLKKYWQSKTEKSDVVSRQIEKELNKMEKLLEKILKMDSKSQTTLSHLISDSQENC